MQPKNHGPFGLTKRQFHKILAQLALLLTISAALGFSFNNSNPIGIHLFEKPTATQPTVPPIQTTQVAEDQGPLIKVEPLPESMAANVAASHSGGVDFTPRTASVPGGKIAHVGWSDVKPNQTSKNILLVDARPKINFDHGHIPGSVNLPYSAEPKASATPEDYEAFQKKYPKDTPIVVYCTTKTCQLSQIVAEKLVNEYGFTNVRKMNEGYLEYTEAESGTNTTKTVAPTSTLVSDPSAARSVRHVEWSQIKPLVSQRKAVLVDARPKVNYDHGHIPGSVNLPYANDPKFCATPEQFAAFQKAYTKDTPIIVYCTTKTCQLSQIIAEKLVDLGYKSVSKMNQGFLEFTEVEGKDAGEMTIREFGDTAPITLPTRVAPSGALSSLTPTTPVAINTTAPVASQTSPVAKGAPAPATAHSGQNPSRTSWAEVKPLLEAGKIILVDVRQAPTYDLGHIPGAVNLSYTSLDPEYQKFMARYPKDAHIVMYCTDIGCPLSTKMSEILVERYGYEHVQHMTEGYAEWQRFDILEPKAPAPTAPAPAPTASAK